MTNETKAHVILSEAITFLAKKAGITDQEFVTLVTEKNVEACTALATVVTWGIEALAE